MKKHLPYIFGALIFTFAVVVTDAVFWADTADYVDSAIAFRADRDYHFWEFGHLFWRPLGWFVWSRFPITNEEFWRGELNLVFQWTSLVAGFFSTVVLIGILKKLKISFRVVCITTACFVFSHAFLNFAQTGTSYVSALMFYLFGLFFSLRAADEKRSLNAILSGVCLALSICFWMPFLWALPAVVVAPVVLYGFARKNFLASAVSIGAFSATIFLSYGIVLTILQIDSLSGLKSWVTAASHGNETRGLMRMIFGTARSFVNMGNDGVLFKRFLLKDVYNPVSFGALVGGSLWKVAAFYGLVASLLFLLWKNSANRKILVLLLAAALPVLIFATLFDGGAVERYLPLYPFAFIALAAALQTVEYKFLRYAMLLVLAAFALININALSIWTTAEQQKKFASRVEALDGKAAPGDAVFLVNWTDDLINFNRSFPFDRFNLRSDLKFGAIVTPGSTQTEQWREEFAARSFAAWAAGKNVWLSRRAFAETPDADWNWTEGDDKNVRWREFPEFFDKLETGETLGDQNGFVLILPSDANREMLREYKEKFTGGSQF